MPAGTIRRHPFVTSAAASVTVTILIYHAAHQHLVRALLYLAAVGAGAAAAEYVFRKRACSSAPMAVRNAGMELLVLVGCFAAALWWLSERFTRQYQPSPGLGRLVWLTILIGCVFNALPAIVLLSRGYGLKELGVHRTGIAAVPLVLVIFAAAAALSPVPVVTLSQALQESGGSIVGLIGMALAAAVPEEFFRFAWQTRVGAFLHNRAAGWFVASVAWAILHAPKDWDQTHSMAAAAMSVINIIPLGLLWGYLIHRTRSMMPSILLHATNVWGLQNL